MEDGYNDLNEFIKLVKAEVANMSDADNQVTTVDIVLFATNHLAQHGKVHSGKPFFINEYAAACGCKQSSKTWWCDEDMAAVAKTWHAASSKVDEVKRKTKFQDKMY